MSRCSSLIPLLANIHIPESAKTVIDKLYVGYSMHIDLLLLFKICGLTPGIIIFYVSEFQLSVFLHSDKNFIRNVGGSWRK